MARRSSERFLRIYDRRGPTRIERETKGKYAGAVAAEPIVRRGDDAALVAFVVGCLREFCDLGIQDGVHGSRDVVLLPWWREFVGSVDRIGKLVVDRREHLSVDRSLAWIDRSVVPRLAMVVSCYGSVGERLLTAWIESGQDRLGPPHLAAIREFRYAFGRAQYRPLQEEAAA